MVRDNRNKTDYESTITGRREEGEYIFKEPSLISQRRPSQQESSESNQREDREDSKSLRRSRTSDSLISNARVDPSATTISTTTCTSNAAEQFIFSPKSRSNGASGAYSPSRSSLIIREEQLEARRMAIEGGRRRNNEMSRKIDLMMVGEESPLWDDTISHYNNSTTDSAECNGYGGSRRKTEPTDVQTNGKFVMSCTIRLSWLVSCILVVLITGVVTYFVLPKSEPLPVPEDCDRVRSGAAVMGQELLTERSFDVILDVVMEEVDVKLPKIMDLLAIKIQKHLIPKLVGCDEAQNNNHTNPNRFIVGNGKVQWQKSSLEQSRTCSFRLCLTATFNMDLFLKAEVPAEVKYVEIVDLVADIFGDENLVDPLQLEMPHFKRVMVRSVINKTPTMAPSSAPTLIPSAGPSAKPTELPSKVPTIAPTKSKAPTAKPSRSPTATPTTQGPTIDPTATPTRSPTSEPSERPTESMVPTPAPTSTHSRSPTTTPTTLVPTLDRTPTPTHSPTMAPSKSPSTSRSPTGGMDDSNSPSSMLPSESPSSSPTVELDMPGGYFQLLERPIRVACAGDSLTRGRSGGVPGYHSYPFQLQQILGENFDVFNFGRNAMTAIRGLSVSYDNTTQFQASLNVEPDIYLLMLGTNDVKFWEAHAHKYLPDMAWIVNKVRSISMESPTRVIVAIPPWVKTDGAFGIRNDILVNNVQPEIKKLAALEDLQLVNMYDVTYNQADSFVYDGLHLNEIGYRSLATAWKAAIQCNPNGICEVGENCVTCPEDCYLNCSFNTTILITSRSGPIIPGEED